jgi:cardiolipin synthase
MIQYNTTAENIYQPQAELSLVRGGRMYFDRLHDLINTAQHTIHLQMYIFSYDATGRMVLEWLKQSAARGVCIYLLVDSYATRLPATLLQSVAATNLHIERYAPIFKSRSFYFGRRLHHKIVVADGRRALVGSGNIDDHYYGGPEHCAWMDMALFVEGPAASDLQDICVQMWNKATDQKGRLAATGTALSYGKPIGNAISVKICRNDWVNNLQQITKSYVNLLSEAREHVYLVSSYFLPGKSLRTQMKAAAKRGVKIKVVRGIRCGHCQTRGTIPLPLVAAPSHRDLRIP